VFSQSGDLSSFNREAWNAEMNADARDETSSALALQIGPMADQSGFQPKPKPPLVTRWSIRNKKNINAPTGGN